MKLAQVVIVAVILSAMNVVAGGQDIQMGESISSESLRLIQTAIPALLAAGLTPDGYQITIMRTAGAPSVAFHDPNIPSSIRGSPPGYKPGFEVHLSEDGSKVVKAHFMR